MNLRSIASCAASFAVASCAICAAAEPFDEGRLEKEILVAGLHDSVQLQVAPDGDIYYIERAGAVKVFSPANKATRTVGTVPIMALGEGHMTGIALDPAFPTNGWLYLYFSPKIPGNVMRLSRFTLKEGTLDLRSEKILIEQSFKPGPHFGGGMQFDPAGDLWLSLGDNATGNRTPETDERPGREGFNALRTAANSQDLRGKIIRIHPEPDGTCSIPAGNLFADPSQGRPEIYVMGCRNPYRFFFDSRSGALFWAEVGPNTEERFGTGGYDEISRTTVPGNSGWPLFVGPTTAYHRYDHATDRIGEKYSADRPLNESRLNTGLRELPKPIPALIWYGSEDSKEFPELGNGGRTAMVGFVYRFNPALASSTKLPAHFDGRLFIYEWCRNWIKTVTLDAQGGVAGIHPFLGTALLRRPIDLKLGPDGAIYLIEYGEKWGGNTDGVISRILYRRGNRPPSAVATSNISAGTAPLSVKFSAAKSSDPDGDALSYRWSFGEGDAGSPERESTWTYTKHGVFRPSLTVTDGEGVSTTTLLTVAVGNAPPSVRFANLNHGGFFEWNERIPIEVIVVDAEDGSTSAGSIPPSRVQVKAQYYAQASADGLPVLGAEGGAGLMRRSDCLSCHAVAAASIGPSFLQIAARYRGDPAARARLAEKIINGGSGAWGDVPMAPHPQFSAGDAAAIADAVLELDGDNSAQQFSSHRGDVQTPGPSANAAGGVFVITATYTDRGAAGLPPLTSEARAVLHARRTRAAVFDGSSSAMVMEVSTLRRQRRICVQLAAGGHLLYRDVNLAGIAEVKCEVSAGEGHGGVLELRVDSPTGRLVGGIDVPTTGQWENWQTVVAEVRDPGGVHDLYVVHRPVPRGEGKRFNLDVLEFVRTVEARK